MKYFTLIAACFFIFFIQAQTANWKYYELAKGIKIKTPQKMEKRMVRDLEIHLIEGGNYDWKIIALPYSSFVRDDSNVNFFGEAENMSNVVHQDPYTEKLKDSAFLLKGNPVQMNLSYHLDPTDTSQNYHLWQFYILVNNQVFVSSFKYFQESNVQFSSFSDFFEYMKLPKGSTESLESKGVKSFVYLADKKQFLNKVYCNYPKIQKAKSYHKILSLNVSLEVTESGKVARVVLDPSKMILITRESEEELEEFFKNFQLSVQKEDIEPQTFQFSFVLFLQDFPKKLFCN